MLWQLIQLSRSAGTPGCHGTAPRLQFLDPFSVLLFLAQMCAKLHDEECQLLLQDPPNTDLRLGDSERSTWVPVCPRGSSCLTDSPLSLLSSTSHALSFPARLLCGHQVLAQDTKTMASCRLCAQHLSLWGQIPTYFPYISPGGFASLMES